MRQVSLSRARNLITYFPGRERELAHFKLAQVYTARVEDGADCCGSPQPDSTGRST